MTPEQSISQVGGELIKSSKNKCSWIFMVFEGHIDSGTLSLTKKNSEKKIDHKCPVLRVKNEILAFWAFEGKFTSKTVLRGVATFTNTPR